MAERLILFQTDELSDIKAKYNGLAEEMRNICDNLKTVEGRLNGCLSAMESVVGSGGGAGYFYSSSWTEQQTAGMSSILSAIQKAVDLTAETDSSLRGKINGAASGVAAGSAVNSGNTAQGVTSTPGVAAAGAAIAGTLGLLGIGAGFSTIANNIINAATNGGGTGNTGGTGSTGGVSGGASANIGTAAEIGAAAVGAGTTPKQTTVGKNMDRKTSIQTKNANGKTVTVKGTYDVVKNVDKFALDQRKYGSSTCTGTSWAMTRNINDGKTTLNPLDKSNWNNNTGCKWPESQKVTGSDQNMLSAAYSQLKEGRVCTIYGKHPVSGKSVPHAVTIVGVKPTADPKNLKISDFLVIDPWGGTTKNMADVKYTKLTQVRIDKT